MSEVPLGAKALRALAARFPLLGARADKDQQSGPLREARAGALGADLPLFRGAEVPVAFLEQAGWTPKVYERLAALADHAVAADAWEASRDNDALPAPYWEKHRAALVRQDVFRIAEFTTWQGGPLTVTEPWLEALVSACDQTTGRLLRGGLSGWGRPRAPIFLDTWAPVSPAIAALALLAGLSAEEVNGQHQAGTLDEAAVRALVALRGHHLPARS